MNHWNCKSLSDNATEFHCGWVNYLDANDTWAEIDCAVIDIGTAFEVTKAPFSCSLPKFADGEAEFVSNCRFDIFNKTKITEAPLKLKMQSLDAVSVPGQVVDIYGSGHADAVLYPQAFPQWDADLIYYVKHGRAPRLMKLIRFNSMIAADVDPQFYLEYDDVVEISPRRLPLGVTRAEHRDNHSNNLNGQGLRHDEGFYIRKNGAAQKRGIGMRELKIWDSGQKSTTIDAKLKKSGSGYILTKSIESDFFTGATLPIWTDATSTFYPDPSPETTSVDGFVQNAAVNQTWATIIGGAGSNSNDSGAFAAVTLIESDSTTDRWATCNRGIVLFDTSTIGATRTVAAATLSLYGKDVIGTLSLSPESNVNIYASSPASNTALANSDFTNVGSTAFSTAINESSWSVSGYNDFVLNSNGLAAVNVSGISKFSVRDARHDVGATDPTPWAASDYVGLRAFMADETGTLKDPKLVVGHIATSTGLDTTKVGSLIIPTVSGNQAYTGIGFQPKAVIFIIKPEDGGETAAMYAGIGATVGTAAGDEICASAYASDGENPSITNSVFKSAVCYSATNITDTVSVEGSLASFDADGFTINWTTVPPNYQTAYYIAIGGDALVDVGQFDLQASTGNQAVTGVGFQPKVVMFMASKPGSVEGVGIGAQYSFGVATSASNQWHYSLVSTDNVSPTDTSRLFTTDSVGSWLGASQTIDAEFDFVSQDVDGFTVNISNAPASANQVGYIAIGGTAQVAAGTFNKITSTGSQAVTGVGFQSELLLLGSHCSTTTGSAVAEASQMFGAGTSASEERVVHSYDDDNVVTSNNERRGDDAAIAICASSGATDSKAELTSLDADGFTLNWTVSDANATPFGYFAFSSAVQLTRRYYDAFLRGL